MTPYYLLEVLVQLLWSATPSFSNHVIHYLPVEWYIAIRWTLSGSILLVLARVKGFRPPTLSEILRLAPIGVLGYAIASYGTLYGLKWGGVVTFALLSAVNPVLQSGFSIVMLKEKPKPLFSVAASLCVLGLVFLVLGKYRLSDARVTFAATSAVFLAYACEGIAFVGSKRFRNSLCLPYYLAITELAAALFAWITIPFQSSAVPHWRALPISLWAAVLFVSVVSCVICYGTHYWLLTRIEGHRLALFESLHSVFAAVLGFFLFHERLHPAMFLGGALLVAGLYLNTSAPKDGNDLSNSVSPPSNKGLRRIRFQAKS